jgi:predicted SAM-dependent methyltransferase
MSLKLNIGCGKSKIEGFSGVDRIAFEGVDVVLDVRQTPWPWDDDSVEEVFSSHFLEHLAGEERIGFFNELYRVMKVGAKALIITPDWSHACAYGDPTHAWPPISSWYAHYLNKAWRDGNAPHVPYTCDFDWMHGAGWDEWLAVRNDEMKAFAMQRYTNSVRDLHITLFKRPPQ